MTHPYSAEQQESMPSVWGILTWIGLLVLLLVGLALYFRFGSQVNPLLYLDSAR